MKNRFKWLEHKSTMLILTSLLAALLLLTTFLFIKQISAWFQAYLSVDNPAQLTNYVTTVEYSYNGTQWTTLEAGKPVPDVTPNTINSLQIRVKYQGETGKAYLRASLHGSFKNTNTGTVLAQPVNFLTFNTNNSSDWLSHSDGFCYYTSKLGGEAFETSKSLDVLTVNADFTRLEPVSQYQNYVGEIYVLVDAVQPDRYPVFWNMSSLPF